MKLFLKILLTASFLLSALNHSPSSSYAQDTGPQYTVQIGDTFFDIARQFGLSQDDLQAANPAVNPDLLSVGQTLLIPGFVSVTGQLNTHTLEVGETLTSLSYRLGLQKATLIRLNRILNPDRLYVNESVVTLAAGETISHPTGSFYPLVNGGLVTLSALQNQNPWALAATNHLSTPTHALPGGYLLLPGGDRPTSGLPFPARELAIRPFPAQQGRTVSFHLTTASPVSASGSLGNWPIHFNLAPDQTQYALVGLERLADPDLYFLRLTLTDTTGMVLEFGQPMPMRSGQYFSDPPLTVDPATVDPSVTEPEIQQLKAIVAPYSPQKYWTGAFTLPSVGLLRSVYGSLRSYNGGPYNAFHAGVDFTGAEDRPITAPAAGTVVFTGTLTVRGNTTVIDHGWGVYSLYAHQSSILVNPGDKVETGQTIGYQGATGRVTGPHLHWELWISGNQVDPMQWTTTEFP